MKTITTPENTKEALPSTGKKARRIGKKKVRFLTLSD
jgi:hypothetical protein